MGVYHLAGLGTSPGAVSSPLTIIYLLLKAAEDGDDRAREFFKHSGEQGQELKGAPEYLILFTSEQILNEQAKSQQEIRSKIFPNKKFGTSPLKVLVNYLKNLTDKLELDNIYNNIWIKGIYAIKVEYMDFQDCYRKINTVLNACRDKECWVNVQAGSNQITSSLAISASINLVAGKYYYVKQTDTRYLDPPNLTPSVLNTPRKYVNEILNSWGELTIFGLGINRIIEDVEQLFKNKEKVNRSEIRNILDEHGLSGVALNKLRPYLIMEGEVVRKSERFNELKYLVETKISGINNVSEMQRKMKEHGMLYEIDPETGEVES